MYETVIKSQNVITGTDQSISSAAIAINHGKIASIADFDSTLPAKQVLHIDDNSVLMPGGVDCHVHVNEPGRTEWEGFEYASKAAIEGGITSIVDMPLNSLPPTVTVNALNAKKNAAQDKIWCNVAFWGGLIPTNITDLKPLHEAGVIGFKCFMSDSGVPEFPPLSETQLSHAMNVLSNIGATLIIHAESDTHFLPEDEYNRSFTKFLKSRPEISESLAVKRATELAEISGCKIHFVHVSTGAAVDLIDKAKRRGVRVTAETCPHYLCFNAESVPTGATEYKCCPPIRDAQNREMLWDGLKTGVIDFVVSDHSPSPIDSKLVSTGNFTKAWGGISSLQVSLSAVWTEARKRGFTLSDISRWLSYRPAIFSQLTGKGFIEVGNDADIVEFAPNDEWVVSAAKLEHRHPLTPYDGRTLTGSVKRTWLGGNLVSSQMPAKGRLLERSTRA